MQMSACPRLHPWLTYCRFKPQKLNHGFNRVLSMTSSDVIPPRLSYTHLSKTLLWLWPHRGRVILVLVINTDSVLCVWKEMKLYWWWGWCGYFPQKTSVVVSWYQMVIAGIIIGILIYFTELNDYQFIYVVLTWHFRILQRMQWIISILEESFFAHRLFFHSLWHISSFWFWLSLGFGVFKTLSWNIAGIKYKY